MTRSRPECGIIEPMIVPHASSSRSISEGKETMDPEVSRFEETACLSAVSSIIHDLRNPLTTIQASAEMLVKLSLSGPQVNRIARNVYSATVRMRELLEEFLVSRNGEREMAPYDLHELVASAIRKIAVGAEFQAVQIVESVQAGLSLVLDRRRIQQVIVNLLVNSMEAMPNGGSIHISAVTDSRTVVIRVRDTGPGIAPEIRGRLFQPFATAGKPNGVGLGLACSRQAVIDHGGELWAESSDQGACFAFCLPRIHTKEFQSQ
jgi:signal transduction histidine kinase